MLDMTTKREITRDDLIPLEEYGKIRKDHRKKMVAMKSARRIHVGPFVTFHFENYETMWSQVQEMLFIERGGEDQIADELEAYNPLIPNGRELVATMLIEIEDEGRRRRALATLGHIEDMIELKFGGETVTGTPEGDIDRTTPDGKTSSVHFITFSFNDTQAEAFKKENTQVTLGIRHDNYKHTAVLDEESRASLALDLN